MPKVAPNQVTLDATVIPVKYRFKQKMPKAVREQLWLRDMGRKFEGKCMTSWCRNTITLFDFQCGHNVPESKGGETTLDNLVAICCRCNTSMGNQYTFTEWSLKHKSIVRSFWRRFLCFISPSKN